METKRGFNLEDEESSAGKASSYSDTENANTFTEKEEEGEDGGFAPIKPSGTTTSHQQRLRAGTGTGAELHSTTSRSIERSWSVNDGYSVQEGYDAAGHGGDEKPAGQGEGGEDEYVVGWDEGDEMNPRNFGTARRWMIVLICSTGSLCV